MPWAEKAVKVLIRDVQGAGADELRPVRLWSGPSLSKGLAATQQTSRGFFKENLGACGKKQNKQNKTTTAKSK